jgi:broad-specificity NMP kinase
MLIIIEGIDGTYKTTVANKVSKKLNVPIIKGSSFELATSSNEELFKRFVEFAEMNNVIFDRNIYSNKTYATLYNDYTILTDKQYSYIENILKNKATVYYLFADDETVRKRIRKRGDEYVDENMVAKINKLFAENINKSPLKVIHYDTTEWTSDQIAEEIVKDFRSKESENK